MHRIVLLLVLGLLGMTDLMPQRRWATLPLLARHRKVSQRTTRIWAERGYLKLYRIAGVRGVCVDLDEADEALDALAEKGLINPNYGTFKGQTIHSVAEQVQR